MFRRRRPKEQTYDEVMDELRPLITSACDGWATPGEIADLIWRRGYRRPPVPNHRAQES